MKKVKNMENELSTAMGLIEYVANEVEKDLSGDIEFEEDDNVWEWTGSYELDSLILRAFKEDAIVDYFEDALCETLSEIKNREDVGCEIYIEDGNLVVFFSSAI